MNRAYDRDRLVHRSPVAIAHRRAERLEEPTDRAQFMAAFGTFRASAKEGVDLYPTFRHALAADDSVTVAALIEGIASTRTGPLHPAVAKVNRKRLTEPERAALMDAGRGYTAFESSVRLGIGQSAVEHRLRNAREKLGVDDTTRAVIVGLSHREFQLNELKGKGPVMTKRRRLMNEHERTVMMDTACGLTARQIADHHGVSLNTVLHRLKTAKGAVGGSNITHAVIMALLTGEFTLADVDKHVEGLGQ